MMLCSNQPEYSDATGQPAPDSRSRLNLLISYGGWRDHSAVDHVARLLEPMGISSIQANSGEHAQDIIMNFPIHIAVVDWDIPLRDGGQDEPGGARILQLLRRLEQPPPTVLIRPALSHTRDSARELASALREGAFAVLNRPLQMELLLDTMRRVLQRHYADHWPTV